MTSVPDADPDRSASEDGAKHDHATSLPEWCNVYEGLTDEEIDEIERFIVRDSRTRRFPETDCD